MTWIPAVAALGGSLLGAASNSASASRSNAATREQNQFLAQQYARYPANSALLALGGDASRYLRGSMPSSQFNTVFQMSSADRAALEKELADLEGQYGRTNAQLSASDGWLSRAGRGGGSADAQNRLATIGNRINEIRTQLADNSQKINQEDYQKLGDSGISPVSRMEQGAQQYADTISGVNRRFEADAAATRGLLDNYGKSEADRIKMQSERDLAGANRAGRSVLARGGMGLSSYAPLMYQENANRNTESTNAALGRLGDQVAGRKVDLATNQAGQRSALALTGAGQTYQAMNDVNRTKLGLLTGSEWTPYLNHTPGVASQSPSAVFGGTLANSMSAMGGLYGLATAGNNNGGGSAANGFQYDTSSRPDIWQNAGGASWDG